MPLLLSAAEADAVEEKAAVAGRHRGPGIVSGV
jgi:hypothetical protein